MNKVDGVQRLPVNGIKVVVIGGGVGGLGAALECWRKGCDVTVLERAEQPSPIGDYFTITPPALSTLTEFPSMYADYHDCVYDCSISMYSPQGDELQVTFPEWRLPGITHSAPEVKISFIKRRAVFAQMQLDQLKRLGVPVHFGDKVVSVKEEKDFVTVSTSQGKEFRGDVCVGAYGIGSAVDGFDTGVSHVNVQDTGYAVARVAFPREAIKAGTPANSLLANVNVQPEFRVYLANDVHLILFLTPHWVAYAFTHPLDENAAESWNNLKDPDRLIPYLEASSDQWDPAVLDFVKSVPTKVIDWNLRWRDGNDNWTSNNGRCVALGDTAHSFLPTSGNGANQALEDGICLAECLNIAGKKSVTSATKVYSKLRFQRTSVMQQTGFLNREELHTADHEQIKMNNADADEKSKPGFFKQGRWMWDHKPEEYAKDNYNECLEAIQKGKPFTNTNLPPGHQYKPWTLESETKRMAAGLRSDLKQNGYWGM